MLKQLDFFHLINKSCATKKDVKEFLKCSNYKSSCIMQELKSIALKNKLQLPKSKELSVPMQIFIDYFHINKDLVIRYHNSLMEFEYRRKEVVRCKEILEY